MNNTITQLTSTDLLGRREYGWRRDMNKLAQLVKVAAIACMMPFTNAYADCVGPDQASVQNAIASASYGARIEVCAGSATWKAQPQGCRSDSMLCIKKGITLQGSIGGNTIIQLSGVAPYGAVCFEPDATSIANDTLFQFAGFIVDAGGRDYAEGMLDVRNGSASVITRVKINANVFRNGAATGHAILINGPVYGVAYANAFVDIGTAIKVEGGSSRSWNLRHREYGSANSFFFEDNTISFTSPKVTDFGSTAGQGGSLVFRYNTVDAANNTAGNELFDLHGLQSMSSSSLSCNAQCDGSPGGCFAQTTRGQRCASEWSQIKSELYGNSWANLGNKAGGYGYWLIHRGSWLLMFNNRATGTYTGGSEPQPKYRQYACDESQNPATPAYSQHIQNTYVYNNFYNGVNKPLVPISMDAKYGADYCSTGVGTYTIKEGVDYFNLSNDFTGASGVGCGTLLRRPSACTVGAGYWATNQVCDDVSGTVGARPNTPISGTLISARLRTPGHRTTHRTPIHIHFEDQPLPSLCRLRDSPGDIRIGRPWRPRR